MSKWSHRIFRCADRDGTSYYEVREVHYDEANKITGWTENGCAPIGQTVKELISDFSWMMAALTKPILEDKTAQDRHRMRAGSDAGG